MFWVMPTLFALCAALLVYVFLSGLHEVEESYVSEYNADTARQFEDLFLFIPSAKILRFTHIVAGIVFLFLFMIAGDVFSLAGIVRGTVAGLLGAVLIYFVPRFVLRLMKRRRVERFNAQLSNALNGMSNALKAGFSIQQAFESIVQEKENPIAQEFGMFLQQLRVGVKFEDALDDMDRRMDSEDLTLMIQSIGIARQTGGNLTEVFDRIAETIRERRRVEGKIKSLTAQGRIQGRVVGAMPVVLGLVLYMLDPQMMLTFLRAPAGIVVLFTVVIMEICGALLIRKIVDIDV
ncbi:MAG: type II secretion system F family protein [Kiritimatiellales bacterium]|nr:type II secretion system F family protein [Kiritimatiellales bacterium]MCF7863525.1 type II secretion system F family protein [Kiritimatiellales bacterium]